MYSIKELYKIGCGPSSSHTIGPLKAATEFKNRYKDLTNIDVKLYGSLALTGKGHLTDYIIEKGLMPIPCKIIFDIDFVPPHPNTVDFIGYIDGKKVAFMRVYSVGGGAIKIDGETPKELDKIYKLSTYNDISRYCKEYKLKLHEYVDKVEDETFNDYMELIYNSMVNSVERGLSITGVLPGSLELKRKANYIYYQNSKETDPTEISRRRLVAYAYAVAEENASGGEIVTAPTCGASGVLPACLRYALDRNKYSHEELINALKVAGLIGNIVKTNGSISGAEAGCQAEIGTACAMAAAFMSSLDGATLEQIESAAEIALEHHLGLTCDPVNGYVQIPCIERNAVAALRAIDAAKLASYLNNADSKISFDLVVETMLQTGKDLPCLYRETAEGGLAKKYVGCHGKR